VTAHRQIRSSASPKRGEKTHFRDRADRGIEDVWPGCVYAWLCTLATVEGLARGRVCWAAGQIGNRPTPVNGLSAKDPVAKTLGPSPGNGTTVRPLLTATLKSCLMDPGE
jgi:hypothetical protein